MYKVKPNYSLKHEEFEICPELFRPIPDKVAQRCRYSNGIPKCYYCSARLTTYGEEEECQICKSRNKT